MVNISELNIDISSRNEKTQSKELAPDYKIELINNRDQKLAIREEIEQIEQMAYTTDSYMHQVQIDKAGHRKQATFRALIASMNTEQYQNEDFMVFVARNAKNHNRIDGVSTVFKISDTEAKIGSLGVDPYQQGKGIGGKLVRERNLLLKEAGFKTIVTYVDESKGLAALLQNEYECENITEEVKADANEKLMEHQIALRIKL